MTFVRLQTYWRDFGREFSYESMLVHLTLRTLWHPGFPGTPNEPDQSEVASSSKS